MTKHESKELLKVEDLIITAWESGRLGRFTISSMSSNMLRGVKIYHKPTGIEVTEDRERSQHKNKDIAINRLREKLQDMTKHDSKTSDELRSYIDSCEMAIGYLNGVLIDKNKRIAELEQAIMSNCYDDPSTSGKRLMALATQQTEVK